MKMKQSKKTTSKSCKLSYSILRYLKHDFLMLYEISGHFKIPKQNARYYLKKLEEKGLVLRLSQGFYEITDAGKNYLSTYEENNSKEMIRLENMRFKFPILEGIDNIVNKHNWNSKTPLNNGVLKYEGKFNDWSISVIKSKNSILVVTCPKYHNYNPYRLYYEARRDTEVFAGMIANDYNLKLGDSEEYMKPEFAISSPLAEEILSITNASQIRTAYGVINQSKGRNADIETNYIDLANDIYELPTTIKLLNQKIDGLSNIVSKLCSLSSFYPRFF